MHVVKKQKVSLLDRCDLPSPKLVAESIKGLVGDAKGDVDGDNKESVSSLQDLLDL